MPWYIHLALKQMFPTGRRFPFFTLISVVGVALGVGLMVIVMSVMGGAGYEIHRMIVESEGDVQIKAQGGIENYPALLKKIDAVEGVVAATPTASGAVMIEASNRVAYPFIRGLDLATIQKVTELNRYVRIGSLDDLDDDSVILSSQLANSIGASVGDTIDIYSPLLIEKLRKDEVFMPRTVKVVGLLQFGHQQLDSSTVYTTLRLAQDLYGLGTDVHGINVRIKGNGTEDENAEDTVVSRLNAVLPPDVRAFSWRDSFSDFLWILNLEKSTIFVLLLVIVVVAAFAVMSSLLITVIRKTREIGVLGALGARPRQVAACFCLQGLLIGIIGTCIGLAGGFAFLAVRNDIVLGIARMTQREDVLRRFYMFSELPAHTAGSDIVTIVVATIVISTLAGLIPAWRAARLNPVEALRSE